jgi:hypothetical protein
MCTNNRITNKWGVASFYFRGLSKSLESGRVIPYFNMLISILKNENEGRLPMETKQNVQLARKEPVSKNPATTTLMAYKHDDMFNLTNTSNGAFRLEASTFTPNITVKLRANTRRNITSDKIFSEWQKRKSPRPTTATCLPLHSRDQVVNTDHLVKLTVVATHKSLENRNRAGVDNEKTLDITDKLVERALKMSFFSSMQKTEEGDTKVIPTNLGSKQTKHKKIKRKIKSASASRSNAAERLLLSSNPARPSTSPLKRRRYKPNTTGSKTGENIPGRGHGQMNRTPTYSNVHSFVYSISNHPTNHNDGFCNLNYGYHQDFRLLQVRRLEAKFNKKIPTCITPPAVSAVSRRNMHNNASTLKMTGIQNGFQNINRSSKSVVGTGGALDYFHVHKLSPREYKRSARPPQTAPLRKKRLFRERKALLKKTDKNDQELQKYIKNDSRGV